MLVAETHGKPFDLVRDREDYLTSAIFGHLRYLQPSVFWPTLLGRARSHGRVQSLLEFASDNGVEVGGYHDLVIDFWERTYKANEPDLILRFQSPKKPALNLVTEVKLRSGKGTGTGGDQLARYFELLRPRGENELTVFLYLTVNDGPSRADIEDTLIKHPEYEGFRDRIFRLQWHHVASAAADEAEKDLPYPSNLIVSDVRILLERWGLADTSEHELELPGSSLYVESDIGLGCVINVLASSPQPTNRKAASMPPRLQ